MTRMTKEEIGCHHEGTKAAKVGRPAGHPTTGAFAFVIFVSCVVEIVVRLLES